MSIMVRDLPPEDRPREKLLKYGAASLSDTELLAVLLRTGTSSVSVLHLAEEVLAKYQDKGLSAIMYMAPEEIATIRGIGMAKAATIIASVELGRRLSVRASERIERIDRPEDAARYTMPLLRFERREHFLVILLDVRNRVIAMPTISIGGLTASIAEPREIFREAIQRSAASIILVHNHPSGDPAPSPEDISLTKRMMKAGEFMGIPVLDHVILGDNIFVSLKDEGMVK